MYRGNLKTASEVKGEISKVMKPEEIEQQALGGIAPHFVFKNPLTNEEKILFSASILNEWYRENCVKYIESDFKPNLFFVNPEESCHYKEIPKELRGNNGILKMPNMFCSKYSGIYFLYKDKNLVYIGQSVCVMQRVGTHLNEGFKDFNNVYFMLVPKKYLTEIEGSLIRYFRPKYNGKIAKQTETEKNYVQQLINI